MSTRTAAGQLGLRHAIGFAANFGGSVYLARSLGPDAWGAFAVAAIGLAIGQQLVERGAVGWIIQRSSPVAGGDLSTALLVQTTLGAALAGVLAIAAPRVAELFSYADLLHLTSAVGVALFAYALRSIPLGYLERSMAYAQVAAVELVDVLVFTLVAVTGTIADLGLWALSAGIVARAFGSVATAYALANIPMFTRGVSRRTIREIAAFAAPHTVANGIGWINTAAVPVFVGTMAGTRELGLIQMSFTLLGYSQILTTIVARVAAPVYAQTRDVALLATHVRNGTVALARYSGGTTLILAVTSLIWIPMLYGEEWVPMSMFMLVIAPVYALERTLTLVIVSLTARGRVVSIMRIAIIFSVAYWSLSAALTSKFGAIGLPLAYALASVSFLGYLAEYRRSIGRLKIDRGLLEFTVLAALMAAAASWAVGRSEPMGVALIASLMAAIVLRPIAGDLIRYFRAHGH